MTNNKINGHDITMQPCNCIGPQNGEPLCPCMMRGVIKRNGRWIQPEVDLGPVVEDPMATYISPGKRRY